MRAPFALIALAAPLALSACGDPAPSYIDQAWVRLSPNKDSPSAGYFVAHGGDAGVQIRGVLTAYAVRVEMHESVMDKGVMAMKPIDSVDVPAKGEVAFAPGGKHLMLWGINDAAVNQGKMELTFLMSDGKRLLVDAVIRKPKAAGSAVAKPAAHEGH